MTQVVENVIVGGGVIGTATAYYLAKIGQEVLLLEKDDLASGASGACDKAIIMQSKNPGIHLQLALKSAEIYKTLEAELDCRLEYANEGGMIVIETEEEMKVMRQFVNKQRAIGLDVHLLDGYEARQVQPALADHIIGATYSNQDAQVNPILLTLGFAIAARRLGASINCYTPVTGIKVHKGKVRSVLTTAGEIKTKNLINCAGAYAPQIGAMVGLDIPIQPRRGQLLVSEPVAKLIKGDILSANYIAAKYNPALLEKSADMATRLGVGLSLGQAESGNLLIGGSREFVGYDKRTTHQALSAIAENAMRIIPALKNIHLIRAFAGLRPYSPDGLPILGAVPSIQGFYMAAGHEGDGIALAPITGQIMAELISYGRTSVDLSLFNITRFTRQNMA